MQSLQVSGGSSLGSGGKRPREIDPLALAAMDVGLPSPKRHAHLRQILDVSPVWTADTPHIVLHTRL